MAFSLKKYNTFGLEVEATWGIEINDFVMFDMAFKKIKETGLPFIVLGDGSDVLFKASQRDGIFPGFRFSLCESSGGGEF